MKKLFLVLILFWLTVPTFGAITVFTNETQFANALYFGYDSDLFYGWKFNNPPTVMPVPMRGNLQTNSFTNLWGYPTYQAYSSDYLFSLGSDTTISALSIADGGDGYGRLNLVFPTSYERLYYTNVTAVGGVFFAVDYDGEAAITDGTKEVTVEVNFDQPPYFYTYVINTISPALYSFRGFASDSANITAIQIRFSGKIPDGDGRFPAIASVYMGLYNSNTIIIHPSAGSYRSWGW